MYIFQDLKQAAKGVDFKTAQEARDWYRDMALKLSDPNYKGDDKIDIDRNKIMYTADPFKIFQDIGGTSLGKMYMFFYDAKHKDTLPYFDIFPLVFPIEFYNNGFLGLNLHYLPPIARAALMDALYTTANNQKFNTSTKLTVTYGILKAASMKFAGYKECIKRYLFSHVRSAFHYVNPSDWDKALMLPLQKWHININPKYAKPLPW